MGRLLGKKALISGGASGIGAASAKLFIEEGAHVVIGDINVEKGEAFASEYGDELKFVKLDVTSEQSWASAVDFAKSEMGGLTTIVNSAGVSIPIGIEDLSLKDFKHTMSINLEGTFLGTKAGIKELKNVEGAAIVNVASTLGHRGGAFVPAYCASKAGVLNLSRACALHCTDNSYKVRINTISPGAIHTEMVDGYIKAGVDAGGKSEDVVQGFASLHPMNRLGSPNEPANAILFLASDESSYSTGIDIPVDGGYLA